MKIKNVEKFREELYTAIKDAFLYQWRSIETPSAMWKGTNDDYEESMERCSSFKFVDGKMFRISLAHPMVIKHNDKSVYMTVDDEGVTFWKSTDEEFEYRGSIEANLYQNRMSFSMVVTRTLIRMLGC